MELKVTLYRMIGDGLRDNFDFKVTVCRMIGDVLQDYK